MEDLSQALQAAGWQVEREGDGSIRLLVGADDVSTPAAVPSVQPQPDPALAGAVVPIDARFKKQLQQLGWRVVDESDGSALFYPPTKSLTPVVDRRTQPDAKAVAETAVSSAALQTQSLEQLLEERRWDVQREPDGSLILRPKPTPVQGRTPAVKAGLRIERCEGMLVETVQSGEIVLPVDEWSEARRIAQAWLDVQGTEASAVGKIRKVLRVYLVSIVEAKAPYGLRHQIAIRSRDGRVVPLD
jgi:hypothetical protein